MKRRALSIAIAGLAATALLQPVAAQNGFLFGRPVAGLTLRAGPVLHSAQGDVFEFMTTELTLERGDFRAASFGGELALAVHERFDVTIGIAYAQTETESESREWVDQDDQPIVQVTRFRTIPVTAAFRFYPFARGEAISSLAWVPARMTPYAGAGVGVVSYRLQQEGDFVDESDMSIFTDDFRSKGAAFTAHLLAGVDHWFSPRVGLNVEGRYMHGSAAPEGDFSGDWDRIDLSGLQAGIGLSFRW